MEEKTDELVLQLAGIKSQLDKQGEQLNYIIKRLEHMRKRADEEKEVKWPN